MRALLACVTVCCALAVPAGRAAPQATRSGQTFRAGIDLVTIEMSAFDRDGRPVEDLRPGDLRVRLDGEEREVVSLELVTVDASRAGEPASTDVPLVSTNVTTAAGRRVIVAVDQTLIRPGSVTPLLRAAGDFVQGLTPDDHVALVTIPEPGPRVDFTRDRARVQEALGLVVGQPARFGDGDLDIRTWEALALEGETPANSVTDSAAGQVMRDIMARVCDEIGGDATSCRLRIMQEAVVIRTEIRQNALFSARRLESYLEELASVEGPKSLVLISAGLVLEDPALLDDVARLAAAAQATVDVVAVEPAPAFERRDPTFALRDRSLALSGLEAVADRTGGELFRAIGPGRGIFERIATQTSAWYVVAVERQPDDPVDQRVQVESRRRGVTVRARPRVVATAAVNAGRPAAEVLRDALASPLAVPGLPVRISTFVQREPDSVQYRVQLAAQVGQAGEPEGEFAVGYVVYNEDGDVVTSLGRQLALEPGPGGDAAPLAFDTAFRLDPGTYTVRFGVVDAMGRRGTVVRPVALAPRSGDGVVTSDLIVGPVPTDGERLHPGVEPYVAGDRVAGFLELYAPPAGDTALAVQLAIAEGDASPALVTERLNLRAGAEPGWQEATGAVAAELLPGRYVARATVLRNGDPIGVVTRPFVLAPGEVTATTSVARDAALPPAIARRTAGYVGLVVAALSNVVAEEHFSLTDPDRRVHSDLLLVRYPGSNQDLLTFRDVVTVNDAPLPGRQQRLKDLFLQPILRIQDRVQEITQAAVQHVPPVLNPLFGLAFLQADFQGRFRLTVREAGDEWPEQVVAVAFEETQRPTMLRGGPLGEEDVPTRGMAWIESATGRLLQTELQVGEGRRAPRVTTRYQLDPTLQIMVPELMRTENPRGVATYSNFRRFTVGTETVFAESER